MADPHPPSSMPCPVCGALARITGLATAMDFDSELNISEAIVQCPSHGESTWRSSRG